MSFTLSHNSGEFHNHKGYKFSYTNQEIDSPFHIDSHPLLFESGVKEQIIHIQNHPNYFKYFFKSYHSQLPFDLFAASFYLVSRYEEYLPFIPDEFNRFEAENSLAYQYDFLQIPLVNLWLSEFELELKKQFPNLNITHKKYSYTSTIDIDNAYKYKQKGIMRSLGGYLKSIIEFDKKDILSRTAVLLNKQPDPFDSYEYQLSIQKKYNLNVIYFYLLGDYGRNDKNHPSNNSNFQKLIKHLSDYSTPGIHPSFGSNANTEQVKIEINRLANITHRNIYSSRQHFSMLTFPNTYANLLELGITDDYSMGYSTFNGFRASLCSPFYWYDIDDEVETGLKIHPFCISETTLRYKEKVTPETITQIAKPLIDIVKKYNGELVSIFHNDTMGDTGEWAGWKNVYEDLVKIMV